MSENDCDGLACLFCNKAALPVQKGNIHDSASNSQGLCDTLYNVSAFISVPPFFAILTHGSASDKPSSGVTGGKLGMTDGRCDGLLSCGWIGERMAVQRDGGMSDRDPEHSTSRSFFESFMVKTIRGTIRVCVFASRCCEHD